MLGSKPGSQSSPEGPRWGFLEALHKSLLHSLSLTLCVWEHPEKYAQAPSSKHQAHVTAQNK